MPSALVDGLVTDAGDDHAVGIGDQHLAAGNARPGRYHALEFRLQPLVGTGPLGLYTLPPIQPLGEEVGAASICLMISPIAWRR